jgi:ABC-type multidrug transport system permease subunit
MGFISTAFIISTVVSTVYIAINRLRGIAFQENPLYLALIVLLQGLLCAAAVGAVIAFVKNEMTANILMNVVLIIPGIFGGVFFYSEFISSKIIRGIMNSVPNALILNSYKGLALTGGLQAIQSELIIMAVLSIALLAASLAKIELKWEV